MTMSSDGCTVELIHFVWGYIFVCFMGTLTVQYSNHNEIHNSYDISMYRTLICEITYKRNCKILTIHENWSPQSMMPQYIMKIRQFFENFSNNYSRELIEQIF